MILRWPSRRAKAEKHPVSRRTVVTGGWEAGMGEAGPVRKRFVVRETDYGYGIWDQLLDDWWIPRLDMSRRDAQLIVDELNQGLGEE
ncbi:MAG TPA: hypothetical protein VIL34_07020 [Actinopolymorphaceae bacterium]